MNICTWFYAESSGGESTYYQMAGRSSSRRFQEVYWRCIVVFFASSIRNNPEARHILFANISRAPVVDGLDVHVFLQQLGVEFVQLPFTFQPPEGYYSAWRNQFYIFDIIRYLHEHATEANAIVLDSDCVWIQPGTPLDDAITRNEVLTYAVSYPPDYPLNGLSRYDMQRLFGELSGRGFPYPPIYCGGEIFAASPAGIEHLNACLDSFWASQLDRHAHGMQKCLEEAHALTYLYYQHKYAIGTANPFVKRIWTNVPFRYRTDLPNDYGLIVWHLPLEKQWGGFALLFELARNQESAFWTVPTGVPFANLMGQRLGVARRSPARALRYTAKAFYFKFRRMGARFRFP